MDSEFCSWGHFLVVYEKKIMQNLHQIFGYSFRHNRNILVKYCYGKNSMFMQMSLHCINFLALGCVCFVAVCYMFSVVRHLALKGMQGAGWRVLFSLSSGTRQVVSGGDWTMYKKGPQQVTINGLIDNKSPKKIILQYIYF